MARHIKVDGSSKTVHPKNGTDYTLEELNKYVGGYIEMIPLNDGSGQVCVMDEEGKLKNKYVNKVATILTYKFHKGTDRIVGDVLICNRKEIN